MPTAKYFRQRVERLIATNYTRRVSYSLIAIGVDVGPKHLYNLDSSNSISLKIDTSTIANIFVPHP